MSRAALARLIADARRIAVFTGAGVSTESGIPDFRSPGGVWSRMKPIYFQEFLESETKRREAWTRAFSGVARWTGASPNPGHAAIARLVETGKASAVITQNVDNLHQGSGVPADRVIELHGNASYARCLDCGERHELEALREPFAATGQSPRCQLCRGWVKTATISFGQRLPEATFARARTESLACDLMLVVGSSLVVQPAAGLPVLAKRNGARLAILNREPTPLDSLADLVLNDEISPALCEALAAVVPADNGV